MLGMLFGERIHFADEVTNWKEAIELSFQSLLVDGCIERRYIDSVIKNVEEMGSYLILCDSVALPHSNPEDGVNSSAMSFLKLKNGVLFPQTTVPVEMFFTMAISDPDNHLGMLINMAEMMINTKIKDHFLSASSKDEVRKLLSIYLPKNLYN